MVQGAGRSELAAAGRRGGGPVSFTLHSDGRRMCVVALSDCLRALHPLWCSQRPPNRGSVAAGVVSGEVGYTVVLRRVR
jgi:hypothetical protein